jgi:N-methylhydantoinase A
MTPPAKVTAAKIIGVDVGGTFTDLILMDEGGGPPRVAKVPTTPDNQAFGVFQALEETGVPLNEVRAIVHGTTATTNAMLERKTAKVGLITTEGFRDVLELGRRTRPQPYGLKGRFDPLIDRELRFEVPERMDAEGEVLVPLDQDAVRAAAIALRESGCEALVIHFLHAYVNPAHERRAAEIAAEVWPNSYITMGHAVLSEYREYERGVTATVNACIQPVLDRYISRLREGLAERGYPRDLLVMQGNGGTVSSSIVAEAAVKTIMSGPASGVMAAAYTAKAAGIDNIITYDMGGTSCDAGLIRGGVPEVSSELELEYAMPIHVPMVDVHTIGAGGGSIASVKSTPCRSTCPWSTCTPSAPAAARSPRSTTPASSRSALKARAPTRVRSVTDVAASGRPSPTPTCCSDGSIPRRCWPSIIRFRSMRCARFSSASWARNWTSTRNGPRPRCCASPTTAWPAHSGWYRWRAATTRATSRSSPSAAPGRCTPRRWPRSWPSRACWCRRARASPTRSAA